MYIPEHGFVFNPPVEDSLFPLVWCQLVLIQHSVGEREEEGEGRGVDKMRGNGRKATQGSMESDNGGRGWEGREAKYEMGADVCAYCVSVCVHNVAGGSPIHSCVPVPTSLVPRPFSTPATAWGRGYNTYMYLPLWQYSLLGQYTRFVRIFVVIPKFGLHLLNTTTMLQQG